MSKLHFNIFGDTAFIRKLNNKLKAITTTTDKISISGTETTINSGLTVDSDGDVEVGKDLEVDGKIIGDISSGSATSGQLLTADGEGGSVWQYPQASNLSSGSATDGQVLKANGSGGAAWGDASGGSGTKLYQHYWSYFNTYVISLTSTAFTSAREMLRTFDVGFYGGEKISIYGYYRGSDSPGVIVGVDFDTSTTTMYVLYNGAITSKTVPTSSFSDVVTEL